MPAERSWLIGGGPECDLVIDRPSVSSRHCRLTVGGSGITVEDLGSTNGTFVDGARVVGPTTVTPGRDVRLGASVPMPWPAGVDLGGWTVRRVGREPDNEVVVDAPVVSGYHARVLVGPRGAILEDLLSANGTAIGSPSGKIMRSPLSASDVVYLGSQEVPASRLLAAPPTPLRSAPAVVFQGLEMVFGRDPRCDVPLDYPMVSWHHARLFRAGGEVFAEDLKSANGTSLNGRKIHQPTPVRPGDALALGSYSFAMGEGGVVRRSDLRGAITIEARGLGIAVGRRQILTDANMTIRPGEFVGLMGPSGAGKSTLMKALNGYTRPASGAVLYNGLDLSKYYDLFRGHVGYVPQEDIIHRELSVGQALRLSARLRLPSDYGREEIDARVRAIVQALGLAGSEDTPIGTPAGHGVSGGQRKRVNLAMELITDPSVLFLDEPTSGLSSEDALAVMKLLRDLADAGKTILLTIHQPSMEAFRLMDRLAVVARDAGRPGPGRLVYSGQAYPGAIEFFQTEATVRPGSAPAPDDILRGLASRPAEEWAARSAKLPTPPPIAATESVPPPRFAGGLGLRQLPTLVRRVLSIKVRDRANSLILLAQAPIIAGLVVLVFSKATTLPPTLANWEEFANGLASTCFVLGLAAIWFGCSNAVREVVGEWPVYHRERMVNLKLAPYIASKLAVLGGLCLFQCAILLAIVYRGTSLRGDWATMFGVLALASAVGLSIGLLISSVSRTSEAAIALLPLVILPILILGGAMQPLPRMNPALRTAAGFLPARWAFEGLLLTENEGQQARKEPALAGPGKSDIAAIHFPADEERMGVRASVMALSAMLVGVVGALAAILRGRDAH